MSEPGSTEFIQPSPIQEKPQVSPRSENFSPRENTGEQIDQVRNELFQHVGIYKRSMVEEAKRRHEEELKQTTSPAAIPESKAKLFVKGLGETVKNAPLIISQLGAIHPWLIAGKIGWVAEPWARIGEDPHQPIQGDNIYLDKFQTMKDQGVKNLDSTNLPNGEIPAIRKYNGGLSLQYLNHNRIKAAQALGMRIQVNLDTAETFN